jgi:predicted nucleic acid-binding protein
MGINYELRQGNIYLDANVFIYLLEGYAEFIPVLLQLVDCIDSGRLQAFTSELSLAETLVKPIVDKNLSLQNLYENTIQTSTSLHVGSVDRDILILAAKLRAKSKANSNSIRLPDAIHLATAQAYQCKYFIANDKALKTFSSDIEVLLLSEIKATTFILA